MIEIFENYVIELIECLAVCIPLRMLFEFIRSILFNNR